MLARENVIRLDLRHFSGRRLSQHEMHQIGLTWFMRPRLVWHPGAVRPWHDDYEYLSVTDSSGEYWCQMPVATVRRASRS